MARPPRLVSLFLLLSCRGTHSGFSGGSFQRPALQLRALPPVLNARRVQVVEEQASEEIDVLHRFEEVPPPVGFECAADESELAALATNKTHGTLLPAGQTSHKDDDASSPYPPVPSLSSYPPVPSLLQLFAFALPAMGIYTAGPLMSLIDAAFVGRVSGATQLAALGPASSISDSAPTPLLFLAIGATNLIARSHAAGDGRASALTTRVGLGLALALGMLVGALVLGFTPQLSALYCGGSAVLTPLCARYVFIRALALPAVIVATVAQAVCVGIKDTRTPMVAVLLAAAVNLSGDFLLVSRLGLGLAGAAWATTFSQLCAAKESDTEPRSQGSEHHNDSPQPVHDFSETVAHQLV